MPVVVRTADQSRAAVEVNPLEVSDASRFLVLFGSEPFDADALRALDPSAHPRERLAVIGAQVYTVHEDGLRFAELPAIAARHTAGVATGRNWRTVTRLLEMAGG